MKACVWIVVVLMMAGVSGVCATDVPKGIAGFVLGKNINDYKDLMRPETDMPIRYLESYREVEIRKIPGFKTGLIGYGTCVESGRILRIRVKYDDSSKKFYDQLLKRYKARFGEPTEWRGDPFHIVINWKWSFTDKDNNRISLHLQHNTQDADERIGNSVKLTLTTAIEAERRCFDDKARGDSGDAGSQQSEPTDWDRLIPR